MRRPGWLRHTAWPAESCCLPTLTRFTGGRCAGPGRRTEPRGGRQPSSHSLDSLRSRPGSLTGPLTHGAWLRRWPPGGVRERPNRHDWKSCVGRPTVGSNPTASATWTRIRHPPGMTRPLSEPGDGPQLSDDQAMALALEEAAAAVGHGDVPVGAVALVDGRLVASRHNEREQRGDPTAHAELLALSRCSRGARDLASLRGDPGRHARALCHVRRWARGGPPRAPGVRCRRPQGGGVRVPLQPVRRSPAQPRSQRHLRGTGRPR